MFGNVERTRRTPEEILVQSLTRFSSHYRRDRLGNAGRRGPPFVQFLAVLAGGVALVSCMHVGVMRRWHALVHGVLYLACIGLTVAAVRLGAG